VSFEYEITVLKDHPEIQLNSPHSGDITGLSDTVFTFTYTPMTFSTSEAEI